MSLALSRCERVSADNRLSPMKMLCLGPKSGVARRRFRRTPRSELDSSINVQSWRTRSVVEWVVHSMFDQSNPHLRLCWPVCLLPPRFQSIELTRICHKYFADAFILAAPHHSTPACQCQHSPKDLLYNSSVHGRMVRSDLWPGMWLGLLFIESRSWFVRALHWKTNKNIIGLTRGGHGQIALMKWVGAAAVRAEEKRGSIITRLILATKHDSSFVVLFLLRFDKIEYAVDLECLRW